MLTLIFAKAADPITLIAALGAGWFSRKWLYAAIAAICITLLSEWIAQGSFYDEDAMLTGFIAALAWASIGFLLKQRREGSLGGHLTRMTNWMEAIERTRSSMPIGAGGGIDSLPRDQQARAIRDLEAGMAALTKFPRHVITAELIKNRQVALQFGRHARADAIANLLEHLIEQNVALGAEDFLKSYA